MRAMRKGLQAAGIPVENSKGEWGPGQAESNVRYDEALTMADNHVLLKAASQDISHPTRTAITYMATRNNAQAGRYSHIHAPRRRRPRKNATVIEPQDKEHLEQTK